MNCANHPDRERSAFCQNCGKPLCSECICRTGTSIFCEPCFVAQGAGAVPPAGYGYGPVPPVVPPGIPGEPNPGIAALLGFIPGVGAMYNEQYAKGIVHLIVFAMLISLAGDMHGIFPLFVFGWAAYMVIEAHHTARARRDGTPLPNPFGLNDLSERLGFGKAWPGAGPVDPASGAGASPPPGANPNTPPYNYKYTYVPPVAQWGAPPSAGVPPMPPYADPNLNPNFNQGPFHHFPIGAVWLIVLGVFFLLGRMPIFFIHGHVLAPILIIGFGVWLFVSRMMNTGTTLENDGTHYYRWRVVSAVRRSAWIILLGVLMLLDVLGILSWSRSWPVFLIAAGVLAVLRRTTESYIPYPVPPPVYPATTPPVATPVTTTDLARIDDRLDVRSNEQEGR